MPKTKMDLWIALLDKIGGGGPEGAAMRASFEQQLLPSLGPVPRMRETISDEEFADQLAKMEKEIPAFVAWIMSQKPKPLPPGFGTRN